VMTKYSDQGSGCQGLSLYVLLMPEVSGLCLFHQKERYFLSVGILTYAKVFSGYSHANACMRISNLVDLAWILVSATNLCDMLAAQCAGVRVVSLGRSLSGLDPPLVATKRTLEAQHHRAPSLLEKRFIVTHGIYYQCWLVIVADTNTYLNLYRSVQ
jgi:hypothetical protein